MIVFVAQQFSSSPMALRSSSILAAVAAIVAFAVGSSHLRGGRESSGSGSGSSSATFFALDCPPAVAKQRRRSIFIGDVHEEGSSVAKTASAAKRAVVGVCSLDEVAKRVGVCSLSVGGWLAISFWFSISRQSPVLTKISKWPV